MLLLAWPLYCIINKYVAKYTDFIALLILQDFSLLITKQLLLCFKG